MTTQEVATQLVDLCKQGEYLKAVQTLYADDILSVEAIPGPDGSREMKGLEAVIGKTNWFMANHETHGGSVEGPMVAGNFFCVRFTLEVTFKPTGARNTIDELGIYQVKDGKVIREEFFYGG
jgi:hypothetical protein